MKTIGQVEYFKSDVDGELRPCLVRATDTNDTPKPLILQACPGPVNPASAAAYGEEIAKFALKYSQPCVALRATGRGEGSICQNYGEVDVLEAINHVCSNYAIDRDRIYVTGPSVAGAATWYLISHYPELFAAAAPFAGYCDYRLWEKPGGWTFHMHEWEEPSWQSRSAAFLVENLEHTPVWIVHGQWDRAAGSGVPVEHSRQMARLMEGKVYRYKYTEWPKVGHGGWPPELWEEVMLWLLEQKKQRDPEHVTHVTYDLRHNKSYWLTIDQLEHYGKRGMVDAQLPGNSKVKVLTENVRAFSLNLKNNIESASLEIDNTRLADINLTRSATFRRDSEGSWHNEGSLNLSDQKRRGVSGPIGDLFFDGTVLVPGTIGTEEETFFTTWLAGDAAGYYKEHNGGVHRGGFDMANDVEFPVVKDVELSDEVLRRHNLILYGTYASNRVLARFEGKLPLAFDGTTIRICDRSYTADRCTVFAVFPHPDNPERYVAVHGGVAPDAVCWGSHLHMNLLPDYIVYSGGNVLDWGFWGNDWKSQ